MKEAKAKIVSIKLPLNWSFLCIDNEQSMIKEIHHNVIMLSPDMKKRQSNQLTKSKKIVFINLFNKKIGNIKGYIILVYRMCEVRWSCG